MRTTSKIGQSPLFEAMDYPGIVRLVAKDILYDVILASIVPGDILL